MDETIGALHDRAELDEVMNRYAASIDRRDWARLRTVFVDGEIEADFTSMGVKEVFRGPAERWVDAARRGATTQHVAGRPAHSPEAPTASLRRAAARSSARRSAQSMPS